MGVATCVCCCRRMGRAGMSNRGRAGGCARGIPAGEVARDERLRGEWRVMDADVIIVGAGPTGLMLAVELRLAGGRARVLERQPQLRDTPKAGGLSGQILELLRYRGLLERFEAASTDPIPALRLPFGGLHVDFTHLADPPMRLLLLPQPRLERLLAELAGELGAEIRRGQEVVGLSQDDATVTADVRGSDGQYRVTARYLIGCDGAYSRVRDLADIPFSGTTYPEVQRLAQVTVPESVTVLENGDLEVAGVGRIGFGFTRNDRGEFAVGSTNPAFLGLFTSEEESADYDDDEPMTLTELRDSIRRVLGVDLPLGEPTRLTRFTFHARQVERYRDGRILLVGDAAHVPRRTPPRRRTHTAPHPSPGGTAARTRPSRRSTPGALPGTARRRAVPAPHRRSHRLGRSHRRTRRHRRARAARSALRLVRHTLNALPSATAGSRPASGRGRDEPRPRALTAGRSAKSLA